MYPLYITSLPSVVNTPLGTLQCKARCHKALSFWFQYYLQMGYMETGVLQCLKTPFLHLIIWWPLSDTYPLFFPTTQMCLFLTINIVGLSLIYNLHWKFHIFSIIKSASWGWAFHSLPSNCFPPHQMLNTYKALLCPSMEYASCVGGGAPLTVLFWIKSSLRLFVSSTTLLLLAVFNL